LGADETGFAIVLPVSDRAVGRERDRAVFVAAADDLEEVAGGFAGHREVAELVDDQELWAVPEAHRGRPAAFHCRARGASDEVGGGGVVDAVAGVDSLVAQRDHEVCLADAGRPDQQDVCFLLDESQRREVLDKAAVESRLGVEVELLDGLAGGEL